MSTKRPIPHRNSLLGSHSKVGNVIVINLIINIPEFSRMENWQKGVITLGWFIWYTTKGFHLRGFNLAYKHSQLNILLQINTLMGKIRLNGHIKIVIRSKSSCRLRVYRLVGSASSNQAAVDRREGRSIGIMSLRSQQVLCKTWLVRNVSAVIACRRSLFHAAFDRQRLSI